MTDDLNTIAEAFGPLVGNALLRIHRGDIKGALWLMEKARQPLHWSPGLEPTLDRVMAEDSLLTRVLAVLVGVPGHHRATTAKDVARAIEILDAAMKEAA